MFAYEYFRDEIVPKLNRPISLTNGCYDILHFGHVYNLKYCKEFLESNALVVLVNSDKAVKELKGEGKPVNKEKHRAFIVESLKFVDYAVIFDDTRIRTNLDELKPDIWFKGADYTLETLDQEERKIAEGNGTCIEFVPLVGELSTTNLINSIKNN